MTVRFRLHLRVDPAPDTIREWTFVHPKRVTAGFSPQASVWIYDAEAGPCTELFVRAGGEMRLRVTPGLRGFVRVAGKEIPFEALRETGLLRRDRGGDYLALREKTTGTVRLGSTRLTFQVAPAAKEAEFPVHPRILHLAREIPWLVVVLLVLVGFLEGGFLRFIYMLPAPPGPTLAEVNREFSRIRISPPEWVRDRLKKKGGVERLATPETQAEEKAGGAPEKKPPLPSKASGFLSAVAQRGSRGGKASPFRGLFTATSLSSEMEKTLKSGDFGKAVTESLKNAGGQALYLQGSPDTVGIGSIARGPVREAKLARTASVATAARFTYEGIAAGGDVDREALEQLVSRKAGELRDCYERSLSVNPSLAGKMVVRAVLRPSASPLLNVDGRSTLRDPALARCVLDRMAAWPFPAPKKETDPIFLPFIFSPASRG